MIFLTQPLLALLKRWSKQALSKADFNRVSTWILFGLTLVFFSIQLIIRDRDQQEVVHIQAKTKTVERRVDSLAIAQKISDQHKNLQIKHMQRENAQLEEIVLSNAKDIRRLRNQMSQLFANEKDALHRIDRMTDKELVQYWTQIDTLR